MAKMKRSQAVAILIENTAANVAGVGQGIRPEISDRQKKEVAEAIEVAWRLAYNYPFHVSELRKRGLYYVG